jgi:hypothetical protein
MLRFSLEMTMVAILRHMVSGAQGRALDRYGIWIARWRDRLRRALCHGPDHGPLPFMSGVAAGDDRGTRRSAPCQGCRQPVLICAYFNR